MNRSQILVALAVAVFAASAGAADSKTALQLRLETIESKLPEPGRIDELEQKVQRLARAEGAASSGGGEAPSGNAEGGDALFNLYQDVQTLSEDVRSLRGEIEELKHASEQRKQRQRDVYKSLNQRLKALEQEVGIGSGEGAGAGPSGGSENGAGDGSGDDGEAAEKAYKAAFGQLNAGKYDQARTSFQKFVKAHPDDEYTDNAWYWLGEARYVDRQYSEARTAFEHVINDFPDSQKVPGAIYKSGVILDEQGEYDQARKLFNRVIDDYPDNSAADLARKRLEAMGGG